MISTISRTYQIQVHIQARSKLTDSLYDWFVKIQRGRSWCVNNTGKLYRFVFWQRSNSVCVYDQPPEEFFNMGFKRSIFAIFEFRTHPFVFSMMIVFPRFSPIRHEWSHKIPTASVICSGVRLALVTFNLTIISSVIGYGFLILIPVGSPGPLPYFGLTKTFFSKGLYTLYRTKGSSTEFFAYKSSRMFFPFKSISIVPRAGQNETQLTPSLSTEWQHSNAGLSPFTVTVTFWFLSRL